MKRKRNNIKKCGKTKCISKIVETCEKRANDKKLGFLDRPLKQSDIFGKSTTGQKNLK